MPKMSELDQVVQTAVEAIVSKRFKAIFARLDELANLEVDLRKGLANQDKSIRSTNTRITQIKCRLGEMNAEDDIYTRIAIKVGIDRDDVKKILHMANYMR